MILMANLFMENSKNKLNDNVLKDLCSNFELHVVEKGSCKNEKLESFFRKSSLNLENVDF